MLGALGALGLAACGGGGSGGGIPGGGGGGGTPTPRPTGSTKPTPTPTPTPRHSPTPTPTPTPRHTPTPTPTPTGTPLPTTGFVLLGDDGSAQGASHGLQQVQIEDSFGNLLSAPQPTLDPIPAAADIDGIWLNTDASTGGAVDGGNLVYFFTGIAQRRFALDGTVNVTSYGGDGDSIAGLPNGDEAVVSADGSQLVHIGSIASHNPTIVGTIAETDQNDGLVISNDGHAMLARDSGGVGLDVYAVGYVAPHYGFLLTKHIADTDPNFVTPVTQDGREGMAFSPADSTRAAIVGLDANGNPVLGLLTGIPNAVNLQSMRLRMGPAPLHVRPAAIERSGSTHRRRRLSLILNGMDLPYAVAIAPNGKDAFVGGAGGIVAVAGIDTGSPSQIGSPVYPVISVGGGQTCVFNTPTTLSVTPDGRYLVAVQACPNVTGPPGPGVLLVFPIGAGGSLGSPAAKLLNAFAPSDDQMLAH